MAEATAVADAAGGVGDVEELPKPLVEEEEEQLMAEKEARIISPVEQEEVPNRAPTEYVEREVENAESELRLRNFCLDLVRPTVMKARLLECEMADIRESIARNDRAFAEVSEMFAKIEQQTLHIQGFREDMKLWNDDRRNFQAKTQDSVTKALAEVESLGSQVEQQDFAISAAQRMGDRTAKEVTRMRDDCDELKQDVDSRFALQEKTNNSKALDLDNKLVGLEHRHETLCFDLFSDGRGLAKLTHELRITDSLANTLKERIEGMQVDKASVEQIELLKEELNASISRANGGVADLVARLDGDIKEVKLHFKATSNSVSAHNAAMMHEVRASYRQELSESAKARSEFACFMKEAQANMARLEDSCAFSEKHTEEVHEHLLRDLDDLRQHRRKDRVSTDAEAKVMRERLEELLGCSSELSKGLEHIGSVLWMVLQGERAASALDVQDDQDRSQVALVGHRSNSLSGRTPRSVTPAGGRPRSRAGATPDLHPVVDLDRGCLTCSGNGQALHTAFKLACLQYAPGPVNFANKNYNRGELLGLRDKLLNRASDALQHGPLTFRPLDVLRERPAEDQLSTALDSHGSPVSTPPPGASPPTTLPLVSARGPTPSSRGHNQSPDGFGTAVA